ncbi:mannan-binding lectin serine protease 1 isoform X1 [Gadus chalcogrammus]|uniref:mannan-binding lectin serine protease 1 isoform X1 n=1 Tax=Gadus chalcogrammus TaxID=1042646 RepID=UPI0024C478ED|nr:mannan-binding lectin serine protease 1 isoform X1 [Gadus chalcogrammus]
MRMLFVVMATVAAHLSSASEMYGTVRSPNFPEAYPRDTELRWNISVPRGYHVQLYFTHFDLEPSYLCEYDFVKVEVEEEVLGLFCGREVSDTERVPGMGALSSSNNLLSLLFRSDFSDQENHAGFLAHYAAVDVDECQERSDEEQLCDHFCHNFIGGYYCSCRYGYLLHTDNRTCRVECSGGVYRTRTGGFSSVDHPLPYPKSSDCSYSIQVEEGLVVELLFNPTFDVEDHPDLPCPYDYIQVIAGGRELGRYCGGRSPGRVVTKSHLVLVNFHTDDSGDNLGWSLTYTTTGSQCPVLLSPANGLLNPIQSEYSFRDHVLVTCLPGYKLRKGEEYLDHYQLDCQKDGSWSSDVPQCQMVDCGSPEVPPLARVVFGSHDNSTRFGATMQLSCEGDAFQLQPNITSSYNCSEGGIWTNSELGTDLPTCIPVCGLPSRPLAQQQRRVVGGRAAPPGLVPWQVLLAVEDASRVPAARWFGAGALLSERWVLTAAHVLHSQRRDASVVPLETEHITVFLGLHDVRDKHRSTRRSVDQVLLHPDFQPLNYNNDIALLRLDRPVRFTGLIRPVCLPKPHGQDDWPTPLPNTLGLVAGWGISSPSKASSGLTFHPSLTSDPNTTSETLQYVKLPVVEQAECEASYASRSLAYNITRNMFCAGFYEGGRDTCLGDSGGAFVMQDEGQQRWAVFGLVSWGGPEDCGSQRVYGVYTRVSNYISWILTHLDTD